MNQTPIFPASPLERVRAGMTVTDETDRQLGTVRRIRMGDPQAVTTRGEDTHQGEPGVIAAPAGGTSGSAAFGAVVPFLEGGLDGLNLPDQLQRELLRTGFIEVDGHELEGAQRYVPGDRIVDVSDDTVRLRRSTQPTSGGSHFERIRAATIEPVLRTYLGTRQEPRRQMPLPVMPAAGGIALLALAGAIGVVLYRRRQAQRHPVARLRRATRAVAELGVRQSIRRAGVATSILVALTLVRGLTRPKSAGSEQSTASATVIVSLPRWRRRG
jgi:hypothetical protein